MSIIKILICLLVILVTTSRTPGKEWHGIVPLHSTRADVERLLGPPKEPEKKHVADYRLENEDVSILFATGPPCGSDAPSGWQVPGGTVVDITVVPRKKLRFASLKLDKNEYKRMDGGEQPFVSYYVNKKEGIQVAVFRDYLVTSLSYFASEADDHLRCPNRRESREQLSNKLTAKEKGLLDSFVIRLQQEPGSTGWIRIDRERRRVDDGELMTLVNQYLRSNHPMAFGRISVMGTYRLAQEMELLIVPLQGDPIPFSDRDIPPK